jgi:hypothetical protein
MKLRDLMEKYTPRQKKLKDKNKEEDTGDLLSSDEGKAQNRQNIVNKRISSNIDQLKKSLKTAYKAYTDNPDNPDEPLEFSVEEDGDTITIAAKGKDADGYNTGWSYRVRVRQMEQRTEIYLNSSLSQYISPDEFGLDSVEVGNNEITIYSGRNSSLKDSTKYKNVIMSVVTANKKLLDKSDY